MIRLVEELFKRQKEEWPAFAKGLDGLARAKTRSVRIDWFDVYIRHIPHRVSSSTASVDREAIAQRPCFLCATNLPPEERGVQFDDEFTVYCNPYPIVDRHLTIVHRDHRQQQIANRFGSMLDIAAALPGYFLVYNGPECGASAPDHMHFQAGSRELFPIEKDATELTGTTLPHYGRNVFVLRERDRMALIRRTDRVIELLAETTRKHPEPLINIAVVRNEDEWVTYLFPRSKHRPEVFYTGEFTVSPASIDLCGIFVVPFAQDFERITGDAIASIFREVSLPLRQFNEIAAKLESEH